MRIDDSGSDRQLYQDFPELPRLRGEECYRAITMLLDVVVCAAVAEYVTRRQCCGIVNRLFAERAVSVFCVVDGDPCGVRWKDLRWRDSWTKRRYG